MKVRKPNFLEYISSEEQNFLTSLVNFREEFDLFGTLDRIYDNPIERLEINPNETVTAQLFLFKEKSGGTFQKGTGLRINPVTFQKCCSQKENSCSQNENRDKLLTW